jgi:holo-[acyl-carrier protein] synthase
MIVEPELDERGSSFAAELARLVDRHLGNSNRAVQRSITVGVDITEVSSWEWLLRSRSWSKFCSSRFTEAEVEYCGEKVERYAGRWAAKEAVVKAIGTGFRGIRPGQIAILRTPDGRPYVSAGTDEGWPLDANHWKWSISISHDGGFAAAVAMAIRQGEADDR